MKLNLGCGKNYKAGFINIDNYDLTVADKKMSVDNLNYSSNTIEEIHAQQLIEHFGFLKTIYVLAEWFRVLQPGGVLLIETPHIEESFERFLNGPLQTKKDVITWLFGFENQGMTHNFCFPKSLLQATLKKTGFRNIHITSFEEVKNHPSLRVICKKSQNYQHFQIIAEFRRKLSKKNLFNPNDYVQSVEQEKLIDFFRFKIQELLQKKVHNIFEEICIEGGVQSPDMTFFLFQELITFDIIPKEDAQKYIDILSFLIKIHYSALLFNLLKEMPETPGKQRNIFQIINTLGKKTIKKMLRSAKEKQKVKKSLQKLSRENSTALPLFFAEEIIKKESEILFQQGIKDFINKNYDRAILKIKTAITLERNNLLFFWNLARLYQLKNEKSASKKTYDTMKNLLRLSNHPKKEKLLMKIKIEKKQFIPKEHGKPMRNMLMTN